MITYLIEAGLIHLSLYLIYLLLLRKETQYQLRRYFLIGSTLAAVAVPFLDIPLLPASNTPSVSEAINTLEPILINGKKTSDLVAFTSGYQFEWIHVIGLISVVFLGYFILAIGSISRNLKKSSRSSLYGIPVWLQREENPSFSFFNWIFIGRDREELIVLHEKGHTLHRHTADILLMNLFRVFFWWLPSSWWVLKELRLIHEFQADAYAMKHADAGYYKKLLIGNALSSVNMSLASSFHHGTLLKRLKAMQAKKQIISKWKLGVLGTLVATVVLVFSCSEQLEQDVQEISANASLVVDYPLAVQQRLEKLKHETGADFSVLEFHSETVDKKKLETLVSQAKFAQFMEVDEDDTKYLILSQDDAAYDVVMEMSKSEGEVYQIVDDEPEYEGGIQKFYEYVGSTLEYPKSAREAGYEGRVYVSFVINKDGTVSDVQAVKGVEESMDAEAVRVIAGSPQWKPGRINGKVVRTRLMVPISYKLDPEEG
ncbi:MAG: TonB family protein [Cytophagales bacterium]|nr:TonB family protein [Cytophagales bacterium]